MNDTVRRLVPVAISARHVHLTQLSIERLFGAGYALHPQAPLSQPGQYAARECVALAGPKGRLEHVRIVGPPRHKEQVEISRTDEFVLGLDAPVRVSGDLERTPGIRVEGPAGSIELAHGVVIAQRHLHVSPTEAASMGLHDRQVVQVAIEKEGRHLTFGDVIVRVSPDYRLELHLDTDEGNAGGLLDHDQALLIVPVVAQAQPR